LKEHTKRLDNRFLWQSYR